MEQPLTLINSQNGNLAFKIFSFENNCAFDHLQRHNYYSLIWIKQGSGMVRADFAEYDFEANSLFAFSPYQPFLFNVKENFSGVIIQFHPDFYCIHMHQKEVACNGVLFNNIYDPPMTVINTEAETIFNMLLLQMKNEMANPALAQYESLVAYLKIFLITASRLKTEQQPKAAEAVSDLKEPFILQTLKDSIESNFRTKKSPADYADALKMNAKALARITKIHFNKTISELIAERIIIEAKRELYLTNKAVKEIAYELGYHDEYYFSRFFKTNADVSPQLYRETVGFGKAEIMQ
ncbi:helix-turn-helix domain-containing protein [Flavobacterium pallidum]|uniref:AraC family transcriptional regulator n=1 Tax=Flavobacterium pallidum TaxID=2172098 RepID=A0A2S1SLF8_9FLAO|nr:helix-turn-helix domain-containing protein [Flavobacterium pallidum]AWI27187.1 AraC family transcriptional regulator [Flavobacterium pallidum]